MGDELTVEDLEAARESMGRFDGQPWAPGGWAEEDEHGVVGLYDGKGKPIAFMPKACYLSMREGE